jgi:hypothetical protein
MTGQTGVVTPYDAGRLTAGAPRATVPGFALVGGAGAVYLVDYLGGTAEQLDPETAQPVSAAVRLPGRLGRAGVDRDGALWVPRADTGTVLAVAGGRIAATVPVSPGTGELAVSIVGGRPVVVDSRRRTVSIVAMAGVDWSVALPAAAGNAPNVGHTPLLVPERQSASQLPVLDYAAGRVYIVDVQARSGPVLALYLPNFPSTLVGALLDRGIDLGWFSPRPSFSSS